MSRPPKGHNVKVGEATYWVLLEDCQVEATLVDHGVGLNEFWGAVGNDVQLEYEVEALTVEKALNEEGEEDVVITDRETLEKIEIALCNDQNFLLKIREDVAERRY